jgi:hypothetical protein
MQERTVSTFEKLGPVVGTAKSKTGDLPAKSEERGEKSAQNDDCRKP